MSAAAAGTTSARDRRPGARRPRPRHADPGRGGREPEPVGRERRSAVDRGGVRLLAGDAEPDRGRLFARARCLGALPRCGGRPLRTQADARPRDGTRDPHVAACAAFAPSDEVLFVARVGGGLAAGMAYPTTLALITALWSGPARTKSIALWSALGGAIAALGPLVVRRAARALRVGLGLPASRSRSPSSPSSWRSCFVPSHVNETTDPVDNLGGMLSVVLVGALDPRRSTSRRSRTRERSCSGSRRSRPLRSGRVLHSAAPRGESAVRPERRRSRASSGSLPARGSSSSAR